MNRNQIIFIVVPFLLIFGYQNCQKVNYDPTKSDLALSSESPSPQGTQVINLEKENIESVQFKSNEVVQVPHNGTSFSLVKSLIYDFDIQSGEFYIIDQNAQTNDRYCLTETLKEQITALLSASSICKYGSKVVEGQVCAQVIQDGYANVITHRGDQYRLGSATDSCGSHLIELCDDRSADLVSWFNYVKLQLASLSCQ